MSVSSDSMHVSQETQFVERVKYFMQKAAIAIMAETLSTTGHTERVAYAKKVLDETASAKEFTIAVLTNSTVAVAGSAATDSDLEFTVNSMFNAFAGFESGPA